MPSPATCVLISQETEPSIACCDGEWLVPQGARCVDIHVPKMVQVRIARQRTAAALPRG
jgi:hypothetical protein